MTDTSQSALGPLHPHTILAGDRLAAAYQASGLHADAIALYQRALADREHNLGPGHPDTLSARSSLARAYRAAGRAGDAIQLAERTLAITESRAFFDG